ncbi:hypothetical protein SMACR_01487 [Sordaria macrospora]|uniref:WGS project CABT00000000 data, contig 2.4 n=2 Tax=Sordaria macrospora TaxID=5147 RepID=F7VQZ1_SORMK|nr:uncharacterized protein SMAC_01487 [Sordaria macrospora k-hell]KAA8632197.1 hypothetical protein SMACR_01487 [Sordaria macrospora]KAH7634590.1 hypothetical protein B0T09DRAFT_254967 [Sordaria sp. MPI-SDFR-AT-0083]WPJ58628.1 hypothetical protein SMAC4_01487 [Sordaria macrospora]CCC07924.1 unnamed protein product [Sordaria macrospora k-hell]
MPGGVCAVLDYEVELMADHVSEMATQIVMPQSAVNTAFRSESNANEFPTPLLVITDLDSGNKDSQQTRKRNYLDIDFKVYRPEDIQKQQDDPVDEVNQFFRLGRPVYSSSALAG